MRIVCVSDLHADAVTYGVERYDEVRDGLMQAVDYVVRGERATDVFAFLGDLCDPGTPRVPRAIAAAVEADRVLHKAGVSWRLWLTGNHDVCEDGSGAHTLLPLRETGLGAVVVDAPGMVVPGVLCLPYVPLSADYDPEAFVRAWDGPAPKVVLGHLDIGDYGGGSESDEMARGRRRYWPTAAIRERWPGAVMVGGHLHKAGVYDGVHVVGSPARFRADEDHEPGWLVVDVP